MKRRLCIGLISPSPYLISLLDSIGVWYEEADFNHNLFESYALLIFDSSKINADQMKKTDVFLNKGGSVLEITKKPVFYSSKISRSFSKTIFNQSSNTEFDRISHLDVYSSWASSIDSELFSGLVDFQKYRSDTINMGFFGLELNSLPDTTNFTRKRFLSSVNEFPDEIVNKVSKDSLSDLLELCIQKLLHSQDLPFLKKWHSPQIHPVFGFRIDSDFGTKESLDEIHHLLKSFEIKATWFLHIEAHENYLEYFKAYKDQELALHGYKHGYSSSIYNIIENIELGIDKLRKSDIQAKGFCAPYGIWNFSLEQALKKFDFNYTSEFTSGYDSLPFYVNHSKHLQIPIHPICTGSLKRKNFTISDMENYFLDIYQQKTSLFKPVFFYHHPMQTGLSLFKKIFEQAQSDELTNLTFNEFAEFWHDRNNFEFTAFFEDGNISLKTNMTDKYLYISNSPEGFELITSKKELVIKSVNTSFKYGTRSIPSLQSLKKLHSNSFQIIKTNILDWKNRYRL
ncbi:MAG: hypothetical protein CL662_05465 [Bacteroidetes bacterium]|nr:hypothetical protein [Bacteroidota bacterium]HCI71616.1 hypothetical protein [Balneola sp.]|tara:strand:- start:334 stop:1869 length:1536 start_codon:yes stop_codon:yes gene_type:complete